VFLTEATFEDVKSYLKKRQDVVVLLGSVEAHGSHLPIGNDIYVGEGFLSELNKKSSICITPTINYTMVRVLDYMPGSVSPKLESYKSYLKDILESLIGNGFKKIILATFHADTVNIVAMREAAFELQKENKNIDFKRLDLYSLASFVGKKNNILESKNEEMHADELETSLMLYIKPELVRKNKAVNEKVVHDHYSLLRPIGQPKSGVFGSPKLASQVKGQKIFKLASKEILKVIEGK
jgi:creatinine amidohydrolase